MRVVSVVASLVLIGCGAVDSKKPDANTGNDSGTDGPAEDAMQMKASGFAANNITSGTLTAGVDTKVPYSTPEYDDLNEYDFSTKTFTVKNAGDYLVCASLYAG